MGDETEDGRKEPREKNSIKPFLGQHGQFYTGREPVHRQNRGPGIASSQKKFRGERAHGRQELSRRERISTEAKTLGRLRAAPTTM